MSINLTVISVKIVRISHEKLSKKVIKIENKIVRANELQNYWPNWTKRSQISNNKQRITNWIWRWESNLDENIDHCNFRLNKSMKLRNSEWRHYPRDTNDSLACLVLKVNQSMNWRLNSRNAANGMHRIHGLRRSPLA